MEKASKAFTLLIVVMAIALALFFILFNSSIIKHSMPNAYMQYIEQSYNQESEYLLTKQTALRKPEEVEVKALYLTSFSAANRKTVDKFIGYLNESDLNALVIDIKNGDSSIAYDSQLEQVNEMGVESINIYDLKELVSYLHQNGVYVIVRQVVFLDSTVAGIKPEWAVKVKGSNRNWRNYRGEMWLNPANKEVWDYNLAIAREVADMGVDEINLDYVRFPSDGPMSSMYFPGWQTDSKQETMTEFFKYFSEGLADKPVYFSADLFGFTTVRTDDMNIGQNIEAIAPYLDYICPMVYPSHYPSGYLDFANPAANPYPIINKGISVGTERINALENNRAKIRPWLQDFDMGAVYTPYLIDQEIQANIDGGGFGYMMWNARNVYRIDPHIDNTKYE